MVKKNVAIVTLGCSKNEIDSDLMMGLLKKSNYDITTHLDEADIIIVNTCGFIDDAKEESIEIIWEMSKYKTYGKCKYLILAGCLAQRYANELMEEIEEVDGIIGTGDISEVVNIIDKLKQNNKIIKTENINNDYIEMVERTNYNYSAYVKISEGCNNRCSYCIIPTLRGKYRSRRMENIVNEVKQLVKNGVKEIILIAQNTTDYGIDLYGEYKLAELLNELNKIQDLEWIRILYMYPDHFTDELVKVIKENKKVVKYVDIPIQHINDDILSKMNRKTNKEQITNLIKKLRREIPDIIIRTTIIVGFPGENEEHFNELYDYVRDIRFDRLGVFTYSQEEGTVAYNYEGQVNEEIKQSRRNKLMELQQKISLEENRKKIGNVYKVLIEECLDDDFYSGRTYGDSPEIDGVVFFKSQNKISIGSFVLIKVEDCLEYDLMGEIVNEYSE
ncbi:30S ribosomal protein S12 methylthiotransferase RimO [Anaerosalibacter sp. Marseille-P3206]|uniref:30S ribosomal protein S12 methylthiotransferase RimO n=1 Tax=Anaerosalibacter sp. Marseille-P3206 TaxID=1871005 RepID=UPI0009843C8C